MLLFAIEPPPEKRRDLLPSYGGIGLAGTLPRLGIESPNVHLENRQCLLLQGAWINVRLQRTTAWACSTKEGQR